MRQAGKERAGSRIRKVEKNNYFFATLHNSLRPYALRFSITDAGKLNSS